MCISTMSNSIRLTLLSCVLAMMVGGQHTDATGYQTAPCCGHKLRHHRGHVKELTCGKLYYRTFYLDSKRDVLYVGAMDKILRVNLSNISQTNCESDSLVLEPTNINNCVAKGKSEYYDCKNHVRVIQPMGDGSRLYICGTNAHNPKDWVIYANLTQLARTEYVPGVGNGIAKCPFDPEDNSTAVWVERGNPGGLAGLYSGTVAEFTKADTVIFRTDLYNFATRKRMFDFKRTLKYDSKWLDKPNFVGSYDIGEYVLFFFRETAVEYINCGKNVYSRVARVCKSDTGGKNILSNNWATYVKARLNCSLPGEFPFYFDQLQGVYKVPGDNSKFYTVFTTSMNGLMGSAICTFNTEAIQRAFMGKFKEQATSSSAWLPVLTSKVPEPRPGSCVNDTETLPDRVLNFIRSHPLMDEAVEHENGRPVWFKRDVIFTHLVVDSVNIGFMGAKRHYTVFFAGTNEGRVYKIVQWYDDENRPQSQLLDTFEVTTPEAIRSMEISPRHKSLYAASDSHIRQLDLVMCNGRYDSCLRCVHDPYCGWDKEASACRPYLPGLLQDVSNQTPGICDNCVSKKALTAHWGQAIHLGCAVRMPEPTFDSIKWFHYSKQHGKYPIAFRSDKYIETSDQGLVILSVTAEDGGRYDCKVGNDTLCSYNVSVDSHRCSAPNKSQDYQKVYSDWCHEFEKYKLAMKTWEKKRTQCTSGHNGSINQNTHPNEIYHRSSPLV